MRRRQGKQKKPKRHCLTSLGPLVSFSPSISFFVTDNLKLFKLLTRTADDTDDNRMMTMMWRGDDNVNYRGGTTRGGTMTGGGTMTPPLWTPPPGPGDTHLLGVFLAFLWPRDMRLLDLFIFSFFFFHFSGPTNNPPHAYEHLLIGWFDNCH
jgi:hypothetical protein